jgi:AcrR family transcriptional regulator
MSRRVPAPSGKALYRVLPPGHQVMSPDRRALNQRARLQGAMVAAVAQNGYANTTIKQIVSLAGVSRTTFYKHFAGKEQCFLATYDMIATLATERISRAYREPTGWRERLQAGFQHFAEIIVIERDASHLRTALYFRRPRTKPSDCGACRCLASRSMASPCPVSCQALAAPLRRPGPVFSISCKPARRERSFEIWP